MNARLLESFGIIGGYDLGQDNPTCEGHMLIAVTEMNARSDIDRLIAGLQEAIR